MICLPPPQRQLIPVSKSLYFPFRRLFLVPQRVGRTSRSERSSSSCNALGQTTTQAMNARMIHAHSSAPFGRRTGFLQLLGALVAAHFDRFATDFDLDGTLIQLAVARCTSFLDHDFGSH